MQVTKKELEEIREKFGVDPVVLGKAVAWRRAFPCADEEPTLSVFGKHARPPISGFALWTALDALTLEEERELVEIFNLPDETSDFPIWKWSHSWRFYPTADKESAEEIEVKFTEELDRES